MPFVLPSKEGFDFQWGSQGRSPREVWCSVWRLRRRALKNSSGGRGGFGAPTARPALEQVAVVQQAVQHGADGGAITEQLAPVLDRAV